MEVGGSPHSVAIALLAISEVPPSPTYSLPSGSTPTVAPELQILIEREAVNSLFGSNEEIIYEMRAKTEARGQALCVAFGYDPLPNSSERVLSLSGSLPAISLCAQIVCECVYRVGSCLPSKFHSTLFVWFHNVAVA